ncbi:hypothetical protein ABL78_1687 [Leptomonas seymouri]|uniref:Uncharacterized protein n=1 Tax=Leptomonas seymouri TaxID=5684 RepID=A0A0N1I0A5_LEPSE|nr:hypothetical protein ABL78_1687 [Leptomonas seymouri]|eukprot:KPI89194.1 hypothetical protein ABL78_1687 [Leptomonas seymouri]
MDASSNAGGDLKAPRRIFLSGVLGLVALKIVSACFHNYQLYEVDRLVSHISRRTEAEERRRVAQRPTTPLSAAPTADASISLVSMFPAHQDEGREGTAMAAAAQLDSHPVYASTHGAYGQLTRNDAEAGADDQGKDLPHDDGGSTVDMSAYFNGLSSVTNGGAVSENASQHAPPPPPQAVIATTRHVIPRNSLSPTSPQPVPRCNSGIFITAVHLVGGEPAPSTSKLISRLSMAGALPFSSSSPIAAATAGSPSSSGKSPSAETSNFFSVNVGAAGAWASPSEPSISLSDCHESGGNRGVEHEVTMHDDGGVDLVMPPTPVIIYEGAATTKVEGGLATMTGESGEEAAMETEQITASHVSTAEDAAAVTQQETAIEEEADDVGDERLEGPLSYFSFINTSVYIAKADAGDAAAKTNHGDNTAAAALPHLTMPPSCPTNSEYRSSTVGLPQASAYLPSLRVTNRGASTGATGGCVGGCATSSASATSPVRLSRPMVHLFIQPRWALAPSLSPACTRWETFLRLHRISYALHEVHVLRTDQPQTQSTEVPQQIQRVVDRQQQGNDDGEDSAAVKEARVFADMLTETSAAHKLWERVRAGLRRVLFAGMLPRDLRAQYSLPFIVVGGTVLKGSFNDMVAELMSRGLVPSLPQEKQGGDEGDRGSHGAPPCSPEEQRAIGQAIERTAEYTLRLLYEVGLLLEGSAVFSHYAAQLWSGHRYWDVFQMRRWCVYAWLAVPLLSALKADVERGLRAHELGGLTREQLYRSLQSDLLSLEQLLVSSAVVTPGREGATKEGTGKAMEVHFLLGREPGPQDCALYAYLLPILRLSPRDIAYIQNPNFTYIYESRVFRGFVDRMSREAFPDLDALLRPSRQPCFIVAMSTASWNYIQARVTPQLATLRSSTGLCRAAVHRWLERVLMLTPVRQIRLSLQRVVSSCPRLTPERSIPSSADTTRWQPWLQCTQTWWRLLIFLRASRQSPASEVEIDLTRSGEETREAKLGDNNSSAVLRSGEHNDARVRNAAEAAAGEDTDAQLAPSVMPPLTVRVDSSTQVKEVPEELALPQIAAASAPAARQQEPPPSSHTTPISPRVIREVVSVSPARSDTSAQRTGSPANSTRSGNNTITATTSASSSPSMTRREGRAKRPATLTSAPSPRMAGPGSMAASPSDTIAPCFTVNRVSAAQPISRSLGSTVGRGCSAPGEKPRRFSGPRMYSDVATVVCPTTAKASEQAKSSTASQLRIPKKATLSIAATRRTISKLNDDAISDSSSNAEEAESSMSGRRASITSSGSAMLSFTTRTPTRQRRPSGLSPGLFTTVVNDKIYLGDDREHPSWRAESHPRTSSATSENKASRSSPMPHSRRGSMTDLNRRDGARSPTRGLLSRTVTPIRKTRLSSADRPTA